MPQATKELQDKWGDDSHAIDYLKGRGYIQTQDWHWFKPKSVGELTAEDESAILYLILEWDYGGLLTNEPNFT